jgi:LysR family cys regulon transcriptional activator
VKLQQLKYILEVSKNNLNVSSTAVSLFTSQPGISKQIKLLEEELGVEIFVRSGKHLTDITPVGRKILSIASEMLQLSQNIKKVAKESVDPNLGSLSISITHALAKFILPSILEQFIVSHPRVSINVIEAIPSHISTEFQNDNIDIALAHEDLNVAGNIALIPCNQWNRVIITKKDHPLSKRQDLTLSDIAKYPIITYPLGNKEQSKRLRAFSLNSIIPNIVFTSSDSDLLKTYVDLEIGIGLIPSISLRDEDKKNFEIIRCDTLFESSTTVIAVKKSTFLRSYVYDFIMLFAPHLTKDLIDSMLTVNESYSSNI